MDDAYITDERFIGAMVADSQASEDSVWGSSFNGFELELTHEDLDELESAITHGQLPAARGFFFGLKVFYNSSW